MLPRGAGGVGTPDLAAHFKAMRSKPCWLIFRYTAHPWADLFRHEVAAVTSDPNSELASPPGYHWLVTCPAAGRDHLDRIATPSFRESVAAFLALEPQRILQPEDQDFYSIMKEVTYSNPTPSFPGINIDLVLTPAAKSWRRLRDVCEAARRSAQPQSPEAQDLQTILSNIPPAWAKAVRSVSDPAPDWIAIHAPGSTPAIFEGPDPIFFFFFF